jgi:hypothetical protein
MSVSTICLFYGVKYVELLEGPWIFLNIHLSLRYTCSIIVLYIITEKNKELRYLSSLEASNCVLSWCVRGTRQRLVFDNS